MVNRIWLDVPSAEKDQARQPGPWDPVVARDDQREEYGADRGQRAPAT